MSVSKYAYEPWKCDGEFCPGDCDLCYKAEWQRDDEDLGETDADIQDTYDSE